MLVMVELRTSRGPNQLAIKVGVRHDGSRRWH